jgi:hypothetical protein
VRGNSIHDLTQIYLDAIESARQTGVDQHLAEKLEAYELFIARNSHRLGPFPAALREIA